VPVALGDTMNSVEGGARVLPDSPAREANAGDGTGTGDGAEYRLVSSTLPAERINVELSARRTGMSFQRTRMSADRTLMSVIRTSLSLIGFGFTIFQFFRKLRESDVLTSAGAARNFGTALVWIGIAMLTLGIAYHLMFMSGLTKTRREMREAGLIHAQSGFPPSLTLFTALVLLALGIAAIASITFNAGPLH
jgi:putative membrane protein